MFLIIISKTGISVCSYVLKISISACMFRYRLNLSVILMLSGGLINVAMLTIAVK